MACYDQLAIYLAGKINRILSELDVGLQVWSLDVQERPTCLIWGDFFFVWIMQIEDVNRIRRRPGRVGETDYSKS